nr:hypothetical protein P9270_020655 [Mesorhizobium sp. WSM4875]
MFGPAPPGRPRVAAGAEPAPAAIRDGGGQVTGLKAAEETQIRMFEHVAHGDQIPRAGKRLLSIPPSRND